MTNPTSNFNWQMPTATDLVTDLPADFEVFGQAVDTSLADLQGGTTGQILSKASNTDMDFTWITNDVGDITNIAVTSPITGGGSSGSVTIGVNAASTSASGVVQLSDSTSTTSSVLASTPTATKSAYDLAASAYAPAFTNNFYAGKNKIINGKFDIWQRGTGTFSTDAAYTADRWVLNLSGGTAGVTRQSFTIGQTDVPNNPDYFLRLAVTTGDNGCRIGQRIENVSTFATETVTVSFYAKGTNPAGGSLDVFLSQEFGSGGSSPVATLAGSIVLTSSWQRFTKTVAVPSISGKTVGTSSFLSVQIQQPTTDTSTAAWTLDLSSVQIEAGSVATPFQTASGSIGGELALCQRYYYRSNALTSTADLAQGQVTSVTNINCVLQLPVTMRAVASTIDYPAMSNFVISDATSTANPTSITLNQSSTNNVSLSVVYLAFTVGRIGRLYANGTTSAYIGVNTEL